MEYTIYISYYTHKKGLIQEESLRVTIGSYFKEEFILLKCMNYYEKL